MLWANALEAVLNEGESAMLPQEAPVRNADQANTKIDEVRVKGTMHGI